MELFSLDFVVPFKIELSVVSSVLARKHTLLKVDLDVSVHKPCPPQPIPNDTVVVKGLGESISEEMVMLYFENARSGGGSVQSIERRDHSFLVIFEDPIGTLSDLPE